MPKYSVFCLVSDNPAKILEQYRVPADFFDVYIDNLSAQVQATAFPRGFESCQPKTVRVS